MVVHNSSIDRIYQYLLIVAFFLLPLTVAGGNIVIWLIVLIWLFSGNYKVKFEQIINHRLAVASILFFLAHLLALIWTENLEWGLEMTRKMLPFLFVLPIFLTISKLKNAKYYIAAFLLAIAISESLSYSIWFGFIHPFKYATGNPFCNPCNPTPLMSHISYNPFLAFAIYLVLNTLLSKKKIPQLQLAIYTFFAFTMTLNMFFTAGRAGQVMFFVAIVLLMFQYFRNSQIKALLTSFFLIVFISLLAYNTSSMFKQRVSEAFTDVIEYHDNRDSSVGRRITFFTNSFEMFSMSPFFGLGTGDFPAEYEKVNLINSPEVVKTVHPHNMYILVLAQLGLMGFASLIWMFYVQIKIALKSNILLVQNIGIAIPVLFLVIMWSDSYLLGHYTTKLFILFSSFIYSKS